MNHPLCREMLAAKIIVILRGLRREIAVPACEALAGEGLRFLEVPLNTPGALETIAMLAEHFRGTKVRIGAGTVLTPAAVEEVARAGGEYIISPNTSPAVIRRTVELGLLSLPGFQTPTEAFAAIDAGADLLKAFPCGTPENIRVLKSVVPLPIFAVGGIDRSNRDEHRGAAPLRPEFPRLSDVGSASEQLHHLQAAIGGRRNDDVVEKGDPERRKGGGEAPGEPDVVR